MQFKRSSQVGISVVLCLLFLSGGAYAEESLNLSEAINFGLEESTDLEIAQLELENAKLEYQKSKATNLANQSEYSRLKAELTLLQAQEQYYTTQAQLIQELLAKYTTAMLSEKNVRVKQKKKELEKIRLDNIKVQQEQGHVNNLDLIEQLNEYHDAKINLMQAEDDYQQAVRELKTMINLTKQESLKLKALSLFSKLQISRNQVIKSGLENELELKIKEENIKLLEQNLTKIKQVATPALDIQQAENELKIARLSKDNLEQNLENQLYAAYQEFNQTKDRLDLRKNNLEQIKENYTKVSNKRRQGLANREEVLAVQEQLLAAEYNYQSAVVDYYKKELELKVQMQLEVEGLINDWN